MTQHIKCFWQQFCLCTAATCHIGSVFVAMQMCFSFTVSLIWLTSRLAPGWQREREHLCLDDTWQLLLTFTINLTWLLWLSLAGNCIRRLKAFSYWHLLEFALKPPPLCRCVSVNLSTVSLSRQNVRSYRFITKSKLCRCQEYPRPEKHCTFV